MSQKKDDMSTEAVGLGRRRFLNTAALTGLTLGVAACNDKPETAPAASGTSAAAPAAHASSSTHLEPGELDTYYGIWSGGHTGGVRTLKLLVTSTATLTGTGSRSEAQGQAGFRVRVTSMFRARSPAARRATCGHSVPPCSTPLPDTRRTPARVTATFGRSAPVAIEVAMALPVSWNPLVKSNARAVAISRTRMIISAPIVLILLVPPGFG